MFFRRFISYRNIKNIIIQKYSTPITNNNEHIINNIIKQQNNKLSKDLADELIRHNNVITECYNSIELHKKEIENLEIKILGVNNKLNIILLRLISK